MYNLKLRITLYIGPPKIPIFGSYLFFLPINYKHIHRATETMARWYNTSILGYHYKSIPSITTIDLDSTKEMLNNSDMDGRPVFELVRSRDPFFNVWGEILHDFLNDKN